MFKKTCVMLFMMTLISPAVFALENQESTLSVDYSMTKSVAPDTATIKFYVENTGLNVADLKEKNDKTVNDAITKIKAQLGEGEQVKTIAYSINNIYSYKDKIRIFQKYEVVNGFEVKLKDMSKVSKIIQTATDAGVKKVGSLNFTLEEAQNECNKLLADTVKAAAKRANYVAGALNTSILKIKSVNPYCSASSGVQPRYYNSLMKAEASSAASDSAVVESIEPGEINLRANVNMMYYLK